MAPPPGPVGQWWSFLRPSGQLLSFYKTYFRKFALVSIIHIFISKNTSFHVM